MDIAGEEIIFSLVFNPLIIAGEKGSLVKRGKFNESIFDVIVTVRKKLGISSRIHRFLLLNQWLTTTAIAHLFN